MNGQTTGAEEVGWDLGDIYGGADDPRLEADLAGVVSGARRFADRYRGRIAQLEPGEFATAVAELEGLEGTLDRMGTFAYASFAIDTADSVRGALLQQIQEQETDLRTMMLFFELEWQALEDDQAARLLADPCLDGFRHYLEAKRRYRPYRLSEPEEKILAKKSDTAAAAWCRLFTERVSALQVHIGDDDLTLDQAQARLQHPHREHRRAAFLAITDALDSDLRTRAFILNTLLLDKATDDALRGYPHWLASRNLANDASDEAVQTLIDAVMTRYDLPQRYYRLKATLLGLERLADFDRLAPISASPMLTTWAQAQNLILDAYQSFSPAMGEIAARFFDHRWIDAAARPHKLPGAFCAMNVPGAHPYVFVTYTGDRRSVLTLAHELGHGVHGYLAAEQGYFNCVTPNTLAETASVFGEALTFQRLLAGQSDPGRRLALLAARLEDAVHIIFRQVAMHQFEDTIHRARRTQGELSVDDIDNVWLETQRAMVGDAVELTDAYRSWWSPISHFILLPGYLYSYPFGYLFSLAIFGRWEEVGSSLVEPYLDLLRAGGSDSPERLGKIVGLDLTDPDFWATGLHTLDRLLGEAEALAAEIR